jgi:preprotein translocase subunit SecD
VRRLGGISGDKLTGSQQSFDPKTNQPVVNIQFDTEGGQRFARMTQQYTGKLFAIILDGKVISAPRSTNRSWVAPRRFRAASPWKALASWQSRSIRVRCRWI